MAGFALPAARAACDGVANGRVATRDGWTVVTPAPFADGPDRVDITDYAVSPQRPAQIFVTNGVSVQRTRDGGCFWTTVFREIIDLPDVLQQLPDVVNRVVAIDVPPGPADSDVLWALIEDRTAALPRPAVAVSQDGGGSWTRSVTGLPTAGVPRLIAVADRTTAYVVVRDPSGALADALYGTDDGGGSWTPRGTPFGNGRLQGLRADPLSPARLWAWGQGGLSRSSNGGRSFSQIAAVTTDVADVGVAPSPETGSAVVGVVHTLFPQATHSHDDGATWFTDDLPWRATSVAVTPSFSAAGGPGGVRLFVPGGPFIDIGPRGTHPAEVRVGVGATRIDVFARTATGVLRRTVSALPTSIPTPSLPPNPSLPPVELDPDTAVRLGRSALSPPETLVEVRPGERKPVKYRLDLAPVPTPLDVYFVVDTTGSMGGTIAGLRQGIGSIVDELAASGIDAQFGVAHFEDYPIAPFGGPGDVPYERLREIGPADEELREAIGELELGGGGDGPESDLPALYQSATGAGQEVDGAPGEAAVIEPGQQAGFRQDSLRVVVLATDAPFHTPPGYPGPSFEETVDALRRRKVHVVGVAVGDGGMDDLVAVARATGAFAPAGTDCNGDGGVDVVAGQPLVCRLDNSSSVKLAPAIVAMLQALRDEATISLDVAEGRDVARVSGRSSYPAVNVRERNRLEFEVEFTCTAEQGGTDTRVVLRGLRATEPVVGARATVRCVAPPAPRAVPPVPPPPPAPAAAAAPPPAPQQPLRLEQNPNPQSQSQPQAQTHANTAVAAEHQEQHELALAYADMAPDEELAMVRREEPSAGPVLLAGAALAAAAAAAAAGRGVAPVVSRAHVTAARSRRRRR